MARGMNHVYLVGALARDPELRYTPSGTAVFEATVAGEDTVVGNDGKERTLPWYHRVSMLGKPAEWMGDRNMKAGDPVMVEGTVDYSQWEAPEGGKRSMVRVRAVRFEGLDRPNAELISDAGGGVRLARGSNEVRLIGNVTRDPELRYTPAGDAVLGLGLAVNENWVDKNGQRQEKTHWIDATLWRELAEAFKEIKKGDPVYVTGRLVNEAWTDKDGNKRNTTKVEVRSAELLARGNAEGGAPRAPAGSRQQPAQTGAPAASRATRPPARSGGLDIDMGLDDVPPEEDLPF